MGTIHRFQGVAGGWDWADVPVHSYGPTRPGVTVRRFISRHDGSDKLEMRYFELAPGSRSNYEQHNYEHAVLVLRGRGEVCLGQEVFPIQFGDAIYVEPDEIHYFQASADEALGFLCAVLDKDLRVSAHGEQRVTIFG